MRHGCRQFTVILFRVPSHLKGHISSHVESSLLQDTALWSGNQNSNTQEHSNN